MSFFFLAKEKGRKRTAPACRARLGAGRPLGAEPVFPRITSRETTSVIALRPLGAIQNNVAGRISTEKPQPNHRSRQGQNALLCERPPFSIRQLKGEYYLPRETYIHIPQLQDADGVLLTGSIQRTTRAERVVPSSSEPGYPHSACRAEVSVDSVRRFALCIWQAPRPAATFGSFWSLQKELAEGRESEEKWIFGLVSS